MKSKAKSKTIILLTIGILFALSPIITTNLNSNVGISDKFSNYSDEINFHLLNYLLNINKNYLFTY